MFSNAAGKKAPASLPLGRRALGSAAAAAVAAARAASPAAQAAPIGPLRTPRGGRYFARPDGRALYLAGVHSWTNLQDMGAEDPPAPFDYAAYLDYLAAQGNNLIRLWNWDSPLVWEDQGFRYIAPLPYRRTGPGSGALGKPRYDLTRFDPAYFDRLRARAEAASARGLYVSVMLWNSWSLHNYFSEPAHSPWPNHPFHRDNNVNGIDGDPERNGDGARLQTLADPAVTALQHAYLRKVVETVGDLDNILYEITNEALADAPTAAWQYHMIGYLKGLQGNGTHPHPVGMTGGFRPAVEASNAQLLISGADWISFSGHVPEDREEPPEAPQARISVLDTDHVFGVGGDALWVWRGFLRGHNLLYMDTLIGLGIRGLMVDTLDEPRLAAQRAGRIGIRGTRAAADLVQDMAGMEPHGGLSRTGPVLADRGRAYVALAERGALELDLSHAAGQRLACRWIAVETAEMQDGGIVPGGGLGRFAPPFLPAALVLTRAA